ncbi:MAG: hypothetical protein ACXW5W_23405, partial [Candidatus Binatia bacterium]
LYISQICFGCRTILIIAALGTEGNHYPAFAAATLELYAFGYQAREQATAMAAERIAVLSHRPRRFLFALPWNTHLSHCLISFMRHP